MKKYVKDRLLSSLEETNNDSNIDKNESNHTPQDHTKNDDGRFYKDPLFFSKEKEELEALYDEINSFEKEVKSHFDLVKNSRTPGSFTFISKQTENILSLKKSKLDIIHEKIALGKIISDYEFKDTSNKDLDKDNSTKFAEFFSYINNNNPVNIKELNDSDIRVIGNDKGNNNRDLDINLDEILEKKFDSLAKEKKVVYTEEDEAMKYETRNLITRVKVLNNDGDWKFVVYDKDTGEKIKGYPTEPEDNYELKLIQQDDGTRIAKDVNTGQVFEVVYSKNADFFIK